MILILAALALIVGGCCAGSLAEHATPLHSSKELRKSYDYVVIGGGLSGLTVANRLTEDKDVNVLVIEYGELDQGEPGVLVPGIGAPQKYWKTYTSVPQRGLNNRTSQLYTGQVVGGGSVINGMFFNRGSAEDYDAWEELGNPGWGWKGLLPYFKKSETYTPATPELRKQFPISPDLKPHGTHGPVGSSYPPFTYANIKNFFQGMQSIGVLLNPQSNDGLAVGAFHSPLSLTHWNVSRSSASAAYYKGTASRRPNFHLLTGHRARKIIFEGKTACGVEFAPKNSSTTIKTVHAKHEVILAAGAQRSPQTLLLSGVGHARLLSQLGIAILEDLPGVGYNFQDQPSFFVALQYNNWSQPTPDWLYGEIDNHRDYARKALELYYEKRQGPYTVTYQSGCDVAFLPLQNITHNYKQIINAAKDVDLASTQPESVDASVLRGQATQRDILLRHYASANTGTQETTFGGSAAIFIAYLKPLSRGSILINSTNPDDDPVIDFGTYTHPIDLDITVASFKKNREFFNSPPMQELGTVELIPGPSVQTDEQIREMLRNQTLSSWQHPVGTLAMMPRKLGGVVDSQLRVYGVKGLRVVDASIMPLIPASHTSSTVYAVAEKAADLIKEARRKKTREEKVQD